MATENTGQSPADGTSAGRPTVFILDDHEVVMRGLTTLLEDGGFEVVGSSASAQEAMRRIPALRPQLAVLDGRLPDGSGIEVCREVRSVDPSIQCLILTSYDDDEALLSAILAGASGYLLKDVKNFELVESARRVVAGESLIDPGLKEQVAARLSKEPASDPRFDGLTPQEQNVLLLIGQGLTNRQIGEQLFLAEKTVKNYVTNLLAKLGFERRTQAAVYITREAPPHQAG